TSSDRDWSSDVCSSDLFRLRGSQLQGERHPIETPADFDRERRLAIGQREPADSLGNAFNKQFNRGEGERIPRGDIRIGFGTIERSEERRVGKEGRSRRC